MALAPTPIRAAIVPTQTIIVDQNLATLAQQTEPDVTALVCQTFLYGIYASIALPTVLLLLARRPRTRPWFFLLVSTILMFLLSTICLVLEVVNTMGVLQGIKLETQGAFQPPTAWYGFRGANDRTLVQATIFSLEFILGDAIVIWRAGALWAFDRKIILSMIIVLLGDFATTLYFIGCEGKADWWYIAGTQPKSCNVSQRAMFFLSFGTNVVATFFIALKAWYHREAFISKPPSLQSTSDSSDTWKKTRSPAQKIMILFLESGFLYMLFWAACSFTYFPFVMGLESPAYFMTDIFNQTRYQVVGLYPTAIVLLVHRQRSSWDTAEVAASLLTSFRASPPPHPEKGQSGINAPMRQHQKQVSMFGLSTIDRSSITSSSEPHAIVDTISPSESLKPRPKSEPRIIEAGSLNFPNERSLSGLEASLQTGGEIKGHERSLSDDTIAVSS
ncbi:hypothetical protein EV361DRAFT_23931 [Lentinula raphanica]|nr:hypothetical protein EV361DRAFT_23931 [Lentinula raphanica]